MAAVGLDDVGRTTADPDGTGDAVKNDPNAGTPLEGATPDSPRKGIDQQGAAATGSALDQADLTENSVDDYEMVSSSMPISSMISATSL